VEDRSRVTCSGMTPWAAPARRHLAAHVYSPQLFGHCSTESPVKRPCRTGGWPPGSGWRPAHEVAAPLSAG
jgi:hypothetical protein